MQLATKTLKKSPKMLLFFFFYHQYPHFDTEDISGSMLVGCQHFRRKNRTMQEERIEKENVQDGLGGIVHEGMERRSRGNAREVMRVHKLNKLSSCLLSGGTP